MLAVVPGARVTESVEEVVDGIKDRLGGQSPDLMTGDEYPVYYSGLHTNGIQVGIDVHRY